MCNMCKENLSLEEKKERKEFYDLMLKMFKEEFSNTFNKDNYTEKELNLFEGLAFDLDYRHDVYQIKQPFQEYVIEYCTVED